MSCTTQSQSVAWVCDAQSSISRIQSQLDALDDDGDFEGTVELLETVPVAERDECWHVTFGYALLDAWDLARAERVMTKAMGVFPESVALPLVLAEIQSELARFDAAQALLLDALQRDLPPVHVRWLRDGLARVYREMGDYAAAKEAWDENLSDAPSSVGDLLNSMSVEGLLGHLDEARDRRARASMAGANAYGEGVGLQYLAWAVYYGGQQAEAEDLLDELLRTPGPTFSLTIAELSLVFDYRVQDAHDRIEARHRGALPLPLNVASAGLQARLGDERALSNAMAQWQSTEPFVRRILTRALLAIGDPRAVDVAQSLVVSVPEHPLYEYLLGTALREADEADWQQHAAAAASACPQNVVFQQAAAGGSNG